MKRLKLKTAMAALTASLARGACAQTTGAAFLEINPSVRADALGGAKGPAALGAEAIGANVANLGLMPRQGEIFTSYASLNGANYQHMAAALAPSSSWLGADAWGLAVTRLDNSGFAGADSAGNQTGSSFSLADTELSFSGSGVVMPSLRLGATAKLVQSQIASYRSNWAPAADVGMTYTFSVSDGRRPLSIGASVNNLGAGIRFLQQTDPLPASVNVGAAVPLGAMLMVMEVNRLVHAGQTQVGTGLEYALGPVAFRLGYLAQNQSGNLALRDSSGLQRLVAGGVGGGVGLTMRTLRIDYAFSQPTADFGISQRISLSLRWGQGTAVSGAATSAGWSNPDRSDWLIRPIGSY